MYADSYNEIVRHVRARTPLLNIVLECERLIDVMLPNNLARSGLQEIGPDLRQSGGGDAVLVMQMCAIPPITIPQAFFDSMPRVCHDIIRDFLKRCGTKEPSAVVEGMAQFCTDMDAKCPGIRILLVIRDVEPLIKPDNVRTCRSLLNHAKTARRATVALVTSNPIDHPVLRTYMPVVQVQRPGRAEMQKLLEQDLRNGEGTKLELELNGEPVDPETAARVCADALVGLHMPTASQALSLQLHANRLDTKDGGCRCRLDPAQLCQEKARILNKAGYVQLVQDLVPESDIGGLEVLKDWLHKRRLGFLPEAAEQRIRYPRGMVLVGPPGTAKSMCAKMTASLFGMPLLRLDIGALFNSLIGSSERNMRNALDVATASAPCVLMLDEV